MNKYLAILNAGFAVFFVCKGNPVGFAAQALLCIMFSLLHIADTAKKK